VRIFVTVDIEGIAGVVHGEEGDRGNLEYAHSAIGLALSYVVPLGTTPMYAWRSARVADRFIM
jgi:hypothetical protein